jgi:hypothetical protein
MERRLVPGIEVEHAGKRWRVHQPLGPDAVLLRGEAGAIVSADPERIGFPARGGASARSAGETGHVADTQPG